MNAGYVIRVTSGPSTGEMVSLDHPVIIGRDGDLTVQDSTVSRHHLQISPGKRGPSLVDLESASGTLLNGDPIVRADMSAGDTISVGRTQMSVLRLIRHSDLAADHALVVERDGKSRATAISDGMTLGRDPSSDVQIVDPSVSRRHAVLRVDATGVSIEDLDSSNGTRAGGEPIRRSHRLVDGEEISLGKAPARITFRSAPPPGPTRLRIAVETLATDMTVEISADRHASVAQVTAEIGRALGVADQELILYQPSTGILYHPDDLWLTLGIETGDRLALGVGDATAFNARAGREWPKRRVLPLNQLPRTVWPEQAHHFAALEIPEGTSFRGRGVIWQVAGGMGAVLIGLTLAIVNPSYAVFGLITGGIGIISIAASILGDQSRRRFKVKEFHRRLSELSRDLEAVQAAQCDSLRALSPSVDELEQWVERSSPRLWERRPNHSDALALRVGTGRRPARLTFEESRGDNPELLAELTAIKESKRHLESVPITVPGNQLGSLGVSGPSSRVRALLSRLMAEASAQHAPEQLTIWVAATDRTWDWCRWLPHASASTVSGDPSTAVEVLTSANRSLSETVDGTTGTQLHLLIVPDTEVRFDLTRLVNGNPGHGLVVVGSAHSRTLPNGLASVLSVTGDGIGSLTGHFDDAPEGDFAADGISDEDAEAIAIQMSRVAGGTASRSSSGLVELLGLGSLAALDVADSWRRPTPPLSVSIGSDDSGEPVTISLRGDGPHAMIAGTTGSGKSELLQTILAGEVLLNRPEELNLFLIDFKGGATFSPFSRLPHVVGVVTDLEHDSSLAVRAFTSLDAEIARRKQLLDRAGVPDIIAYENAADSELPPLANLVVVIDEFALLVERQPEVKERLDTIATQGRSLGIHMILATQSPSGVITHAIRTNTNLWLCLRVVTDSESVELLGSRAAARISDRTPGRAILRQGASTDLREFQAARIGRTVRADDTPVSVTRITPGPSEPRPVASQGLTTELELVLDQVVDASERLGCARQDPLWLEPLPFELDPDDLPGTEPPLTTGGERHLCAVVGLTDDPARHAQYPNMVDLSAAGNLLVLGVYGSGKSTALRQVALDLSTRNSPAEVHIYCIDGGAGGLRSLGDVPNVGDVVPAGDGERLTRLVERLTRLVAQRRESTEIIDRGGFLDAREHTGLPWIVVLVDDFPMFREAAEGIDNGRLIERFNSLLQSGPPVGVHIVIASSQSSDLRTRELNLLQGRLILRAADSSDYSLADPRFNPSYTPQPVAGRGLVQGLLEVQVALPHKDSEEHISARWADQDRTGWPRPVRRLPTTVSAEDIDSDLEGVPIGLGGPEVETVAVELSVSSPILLVAGPRQSGRSSALAHLRGQVIKSGRQRSVLMSPRGESGGHDGPSGGGTGSSHEVLTATEDFVAALDRIIEDSSTPAAVFIDDAESVAGVPGLADRLDWIVRNASQTDTLVVVAARVNDVPTLFDPWARYVVSLRRALLLTPTPDDLFLFGHKQLNIPEGSPPGRGFLVEGSTAVTVQVVQP